MQNGLAEAINVANQAIDGSKAYQAFLRRHNHNLSSIKKSEDFFNLPITDKKNYILLGSYRDLLQKNFAPMAYASSGSSGQPTFWFRSDEHEAAGGLLHEKIFKDIYKIKKQEPTLAVVCFSMGVWIAGNYTLACCRWLAGQGYKITTITPGIEKQDCVNILRTMAPEFKNLVIAGYPSFVMDVLTETKKQKIKLPKSTKILTAGDCFSEGWRSAISKLLGGVSPQSILSLYGSADAGVMGFETPITIAIRKTAQTNKALRANIFGESERQPAFMQFEPKSIFFESIDNELAITCNTAIPLIRYNIHDVGKIFTSQEMSAILSEHGLNSEAKLLKHWPLPFVMKKGRTDVAVTFYALNIYPEHISAGFRHPKIAKLVSGNFRAFNKTTNRHSKEELVIEVELAKNTRPLRQTLKNITGAVTTALQLNNIEFRKLYGAIGLKAIPKIKLFSNLAMQTVAPAKALLNIEGKKPKMVI